MKSRLHPENSSLSLAFMSRLRKIKSATTAGPNTGCTVSQAVPKGERLPSSSSAPWTWYWVKENVGLRENLSQAFLF